MTAGDLRSGVRWVLRRVSSLGPRRADYRAMARDPRRDLIAGVTVGVVALPLALAFGVTSGMGAGAGLITAIVAGVVAAVFGGSNLQVSGPTGAMTVVLVPIIATYGPDGVLVVNSPDEPGWRHLADVVAGLRGAFAHTALVAMRDVLKGRRYGNAVLVAAHRTLDLDEIRRQVARWPFPSGVLAGAELTRRTASGRALTDGGSRPSPRAPDPRPGPR